MQQISDMKRFRLFLLLLLSLGTLRAHKPADTLSAVQWEFVQNLGQWNPAVTFSARMNGGTLFFENNSFVVAQLHPQQLQDLYEAKHNGKPLPSHPLNAAAYRVTLLNANLKPAIAGEKPYEHYYNFFLGNDPKRWASHVYAYNTLS